MHHLLALWIDRCPSTFKYIIFITPITTDELFVWFETWMKSNISLICCYETSWIFFSVRFQFNVHNLNETNSFEVIVLNSSSSTFCLVSSITSWFSIDHLCGLFQPSLNTLMSLYITVMPVITQMRPLNFHLFPQTGNRYCLQLGLLGFFSVC